MTCDEIVAAVRLGMDIEVMGAAKVGTYCVLCLGTVSVVTGAELKRIATAERSWLVGRVLSRLAR